MSFAPLAALAGRRQEDGAEPDQDGADRHVDEEDPLPAEGARQQAAEQGAGRAAALTLKVAECIALNRAVLYCR